MENEKKDKDYSFIKSLLNNQTLLRFVKKFSCDNLLDDNKLAEGFGVKCNEDSISLGDKSMTKMLVSNARFSGNEFVRFNLKQLKETLEITGAEGEMIISADNNKELFCQAGNNIVIVSPLPNTDTKKE